MNESFVKEARWQLNAAHKGVRLDHFLSEMRSDLSRSFIKKCISEGQVTLDNEVLTKAGYKLKDQGLLSLTLQEPTALDVEAEDIPLDIVYEDSSLLVINKPVGLVVHPGAGNPTGTLVNALLHHCTDLSGIGGVERPGIVHRLDKDTSGLLVVAKNDKAHVSLSQQLQTRDMKRHYYALAEHSFKEHQGTIEAPIGRHPQERKKMAVVANGRFARTHWTVKDEYPGYTWLALELDTGRTHQIRVHLKHIHRPLVGDPVYGSNRKHPFKVERPLLHAFELRFFHPETQQLQTFEAPLPDDFAHILKILKAQ